MRVVVGILHFHGPNGAATYAHVVARHLARLGHDVRIHTEDAGPMAELARESGLEVGALPPDEPPDAMLANDAMIAFAMAARWPGVPQVFIAHGAYRDEAMPPQLPQVSAAAVAMNERVAARVRALAGDVPLVRLRQPIDLERFRPRGEPRPSLRRVLLLGNYLQGAAHQLVADACEGLGAEISQVGAHGEVDLRPERAIADADAVIGYGRSVLEGLACGRAGFVLDHRGADGWVDQRSYGRLEADGFAGLTSDRALDWAGLREALAAYEPGLGAQGRKLAAVHHDAFKHAGELSEILKQLPAPTGLEPDAAHELARLARLQWESEWRSGVLLDDIAAEHGRSRMLEEELQHANTRADKAESRALAAEASAAATEARLADLKATRRYRIATGMGRPLDRVRALGRRGRLFRGG